MAELLVRHGAPVTTLTGADAFRAACVRRDRAAAHQLLAEDVGLMNEARVLLVDEAAKRDLADVATLLLDLGLEPDTEHEGPGGRYRALHQAACMDALAVIDLLVQRGADVDARDSEHQATPLAWALHTNMTRAIELLARHSRDVFTLVAGGCLEPLRALLAQDGSLANTQAPRRLGLGAIGVETGETPLFALPGDEALAVVVAELLSSFGADHTIRNAAGQTPADKARERGLADVAASLSER